MKIGVPTEVKNNENRVALTPAGADQLVREGHRVLVQSGAGIGSSIDDDAYRAAGAEIVDTAADAWGEADLLIKVKEPVAEEYGFLRPDLTLFTYLHLAADRPLTEALVAAGTTAVAYETVQLPDRTLPLLVPMSEIAGRLSVIMGSHSRCCARRAAAACCWAASPALPGQDRGHRRWRRRRARGRERARTRIEGHRRRRGAPRLRELEHRYGGALETRASSRYDIAEELTSADLVIGSVLIPGAAAPSW